MASIEFIEKRLDGKKKELDKLEKKLTRILKAEESNYEKDNPYYYNDYDKKSTLKEIDICKNDISKYEQQLSSEIEKSNSRDITAILDFLSKWKERVYTFYKNDLEEYYIEKQLVRDAFLDYDKNRYSENREELLNHYDEVRKTLYCKLNGYKERKSFINHWGKEDYRDVKVKDGEWEHLKHYIERSDGLDDCLKLLDKELEQEKNRKYDFIIERTNKIVGQITDAQGLRISGDGELNGIILGTRGKASVSTIGAGGYNDGVIVNVKHGQIFHYRTLIKEIK